MKILGIETSCDETAVSLIDASGDFGFASPKRATGPAKAGADFTFRILGNALLSQVITHVKFGGVVPNLARREHEKNLVPMLEHALEEAGIHPGGKPSDISPYTDRLRSVLMREPELYAQLSVFLQKYARPDIDAIAVTVGPGLEPALWVGINFARALSMVWDVPIVATNHMEGHIVMSLMDIEPNKSHSNILQNVRMTGKMHALEFPLLALLISGGHTELILMKAPGTYEYLGRTRDDAVGEAFDKVARMLGLPYPGGPPLSALAERARIDADRLQVPTRDPSAKKYTQINADRNLRESASPVRTSAIILPRPMLHDDTFDFSFAGLKTAVLKIVEVNSPLTDELKMAIAREFEDAAADVLVAKTMRACDEYGVRMVVVGGGVSANKHIRLRLAEALEEAGLPRPLVPPPAFATDNAVMIALAGYFHAKNGAYAEPENLKAEGNLKLK